LTKSWRLAKIADFVISVFFVILYCLLLCIVLQRMLSEPDMRRIANTDAAATLQSHPSVYQQLVLQCVSASQLFHSMLTAV